MEKTKKSRVPEVLDLMRNNASFIILFMMITIGTIITDTLLTKDNIFNVLCQVSINGVLAAGFTIVIMADGFDLSVGSIVSLSAVVTIGVLNATGSIFLGILTSMAVGLFCGLCNGTIIRVIKGDYSDSFLITMGTSLIMQGVAYAYTKGFTVYTPDNLPEFRAIARGSVFGIPYLAIIFVFVTLIFQIVLRNTMYGRKLTMTGGNKLASYMSGINTHQITISSFMLSGLCAGMAALLLCARTGSAHSTTGQGYEVDAAIAVIVGGNLAGKKNASLWKTFAGALILGLISNIMNLLNIDTVIQKVVKGAILLLALYVDSLRKE